MLKSVTQKAVIIPDSFKIFYTCRVIIGSLNVCAPPVSPHAFVVTEGILEAFGCHHKGSQFDKSIVSL